MAQSLSAANAAALDSLGVSKSEFTSALSAAEQACADFIKRVKENIQSIPDFVNTGSIENLTLESAGDEVHITGPEHILYQYKGVNGSEIAMYDTPYKYGAKRPPVASFLLWIQSKNIRLVHNERYYGKPSPFKETTGEKQQISLAWAISTKIFKEGMKPHPAIGWDKEKEQLKQDLAKYAKGFVIQKLKTEIYNQYGDNVEAKSK